MKAFVIPKQTGVTLVELVISIVILGIALVAIVSVISSSVGRSSDVLLLDRSIQLAQAYMDEILGKRFDESTPIGGFPPVTTCNINTEESDRDDYDDVDDYHGLNESPSSQTTAAFANYVGYSVTVSVVCAGVEIGVDDAMAKRVTLTVTPVDGPAMTFAAYKGNF